MLRLQMFTGLSTLRKHEKKTVEQTEESKKLQEYLQKYTSGEEDACDWMMCLRFQEKAWARLSINYSGCRRCRWVREKDAEKEETCCSGV